ncbi:hypothetical protein [Streptomyces pseudogriseolus]|uniref:hypothetical protein n=1 Tax=Streptomyces pseudogriseolus TaxID=36817 RepID=UPI003FA1BC30
MGEAYGILHEPVLDAITTVTRTEGIILDPVYTGRAAAGLMAAVRDGSIRPGERTVLLHTGGTAGAVRPRRSSPPYRLDPPHLPVTRSSPELFTS